MRARKLFTIAALLAASLAMGTGLAGRDNPDGKEDEDNPGSGGVDWTNYQTGGSYAIRIKNEANRGLVAFKDSVSAANLLGGVPKNKGDWGLKKDTTHFNQNADFSLIFITKEDYEAKKDNPNLLAEMNQKPFTRIFAAYNASGANEVPWIVSGKLGGNNKLVINNLTSYNMELRQDSPRGTTLGYAPYQANNTTLNMNDGSFYIFPVFKKYNALRDEIITIYPYAGDGLPMGDEFSFVNGQELTINAAKYTGANKSGFSSGAALLVIKNASEQGITVMEGIYVKKTETGISTINSGGEERTFTILMDSLSEGRYESSKQLSGWKIVNLGTREKAIAAATPLDADYRYTVTVDGDWNDGVDHVTVSTPVKGNGKITDEF
ncbi:MAG: hypothetical protein LBD37_00230 [Treponema sp.]|jgi:hypothetical protein|nr:hypothetical protein [Treponema sp.]